MGDGRENRALQAGGGGGRGVWESGSLVCLYSRPDWGTSGLQRAGLLGNLLGSWCSPFCDSPKTMFGTDYLGNKSSWYSWYKYLSTPYCVIDIDILL